MSIPSGILVVDDDAASLRELLTLLRNLGYRATGAADVPGACALLDAFAFSLLITDVRLHRDSGLKLIRRAREVQPAMAIIAITGFPDAAVEKEIARFGAVYMRKPLDLRRLREILAEKVTAGRKQRRWQRKHVAGGFRATVCGASARIVDMSYGGFRLEMAQPPETVRAPRIDVDLLPFGFKVNAELVWMNRNEPTGAWSCGAALSELESSIARAWRGVVDALPEQTSAGTGRE
jgi:CheY-like chemotaxis protein